MLIYHAAHQDAIWLNMDNYGRIQLSDRDRLELINRISTNKLKALAKNQGTATLFLNANARIQEHVTLINRGEKVLVVTEAERAEAFTTFLRRQIFWNDRLQVENQSATLSQLGVFGRRASEYLRQWWPDIDNLGRYQALDDDSILAIRVRDIAAAPAFWIIAEAEKLAPIQKELSRHLPEASPDDYDILRIEAGLPAVEHELSADYIPLEIGLWDIISFNKGCYTGQEIIARMESRGQLAKKLVKISADVTLQTGDDVYNAEGKKVGTITSAATIPSDPQKQIGLAVVKAVEAVVDGSLFTNDSETIRIYGLAGHYTPSYD